MEKRIITISREFGSGGRTIGKLVAEHLGIRCYDAELIQKLAAESGFDENYIKEAGEYTPGGFLASAFADRIFGPTNEDLLWKLQYRIIRELAEKEPCVIVGRCADYALADYPNTVSVFITGNDENKLNSIKTLYHVDDAKAKDIMVKTDKKRSSYYNYYSSKKWGDSRSYDMCINSSVLGPEGTADMIIAFAKAKEAQNQKKTE